MLDWLVVNRTSPLWELYAWSHGRTMKPALRLDGRILWACLMGAILLAGVGPGAAAGTAVGDWGHFLRYAPRLHLLNPDGRAFSVTVHRFRWPVAAWNPKQVAVRLTAPDGTVAVDGKHDLDGDDLRLPVPAGAKGVYVLEVNLPVTHPVSGPDFWVESSLDRAVVWTGNPTGHAVLDRWLIVQCSVPRRWWFWVPPGTKSFTCSAQWIHNYQSQREDWGITVFSPRGQRVRTLWGDLDYDKGRPFDTDASRTVSAAVNVDPGAAGHFWCVELRFADSHNYSKVSFTLDGVPPYVARSPEEWFDPATGQVPVAPLYDNDPFMQFARPQGGDAWPWLMHFSPCPSLGDPDGAEIRGDADFALWNPENRPLKFRIGSYLPRDMDAAQPQQATVGMTGPGGAVILNRAFPIEHLHGEHGAPEALPATGAGVVTTTVSGVERWFAFTYPATPLELCGRADGHGWQHFNLECGTARNWYFMVPPGTRQFSVRAAAQHPTDVMHLEINAPDRTMALIYDREGEKTIDVPPGLDGKIWYLRPDIGSATTMPNTPGDVTRYLHLNLALDLKGIPGLLAPTREQWFDPDTPGAAAVQAETVIYKRTAEHALALHLFASELRPTPATPRRPVVLFIHGGGWSAGTPDLFFQHGRYFAARGYLAAAVQYRLASRRGATLFDCLADVRSAMRWLRSHAAELDIDPQRIAVAGDSAGGHLAACLGVIDGFDDPADDKTVSSRPDAMVLYNGVLDLTAPDGWRHLNPDLVPRAAEISPIDHIRAGAPPALLIHGAADTVAPAEWSRRFAQLMKDAGNRAECVILDDQKHAFILYGYGDSQTVGAALGRTATFLAAAMPPPHN